MTTGLRREPAPGVGGHEPSRSVRRLRLEYLRRRKRRFLLVGLTLGAAILALTLWNTLHLHLPIPPSATDISPSLAVGEWALSQRDPQRTGFAPDEGALPQGVLLWRREQSSRIITPPILSDGILFVATEEGRILALLSTTGEVAWEHALPSPVDLPVAVAGDYVYAVQRNGGVAALHKGNGGLLWDFHAPDSVLAAPLASGGVVYLSTREPRLYAIDAATGQVRWTYKLTAFSLSPPSLFDTVLALGTEDGNLHLVDARKGTPRRLYPTGSPLRGAPVLADGRVYVAGNSRYVWALDLYAQELPLEKALHAWWWQFHLWGMAPRPPPLRGMVWVVDRKGETFSGGLGAAHGLLYFGSAGGNGKGSIYALDRATGALVWRFATRAPVSSSPVIAGGMVYMGADDGAYYGLDALTGEEQWRFELGRTVLGGPAVGRGVLYLTGGDGALYAIG